MTISTLPNDLVDALNVIGIEPLRANSFVVEISGQPFGRHLVGGFSEIDGLNLSGTTIEIREGGYDSVHEFPGPDRCQPITLRRPMTTSRYFWDWYQAVRNWEKGQASYAKDVAITHLEWREGIAYEVWSWSLRDAWVGEWSRSAFNALSNDLAVETVILHHAGLIKNSSLLDGTVGEVFGILAS